jgi:sulfate transport system substrate-binding protein
MIAKRVGKPIMAVAVLVVAFLTAGGACADVALLNVSYDPTRELYQDYNLLFSNYWKAKTGQVVTINQSHGGSSAQARSVIDGLEADVVTLGVPPDVDAIASKAGLVTGDWASRLPNRSSPYTSTVVFLVRKGNPKHIKDWPDLVKPGIAVITANPKTSAGARVNYLAAWGYALKTWNNDEVKATAFLQSLYKNVPVLDSGARGSTLTFAQRGVGDVLLAWENEAELTINETGKGEFEIVVPSTSILAEPPVAVVDKVVDKRGTRVVAEEYLRYLYTREGQETIARHYYRPRDPVVAELNASAFPKVSLFTADSIGGWSTLQKKHFDDGGVFDHLIDASKK